MTNEKFEILFQTALLFDEVGLQSWSKFICRLSSKPLETFELFDSKENLLRLLYIWNLSRKQVESDKALLIELQVVKYFHFNQLDLRECGLVCLGFHKTQTKFQSNLIEQITDKLINEIDKLEDPICLASILKGIFSSDYRLEREMLNKLKDKILNSKFSDNFLILTKILQIERRQKHYDERLINQTLEVLSQQDNVRIKEMSRLLLNLLFFDVQLNSKQIGKFNELFEHFKSNFAVYRIEYLLSVYALASHGLIRKEEIYNIFDEEFIKILRTKYHDVNYFFINLNNILKLYGGINYSEIALKDKDLLRYFKNFSSVNKKDVYAKFKKFEHYPSKIYLTYQTLKECLEEGRVHLVHVLPGLKYPSIVITPNRTTLKDYPFEVAANSVTNSCIVQLPNLEAYCDRDLQRLNGFFRLESDLLKKMGFKMFELDNHRISHNVNELKVYLKAQVLDLLESNS